MLACHAAGPGSIPGRDRFPGWGFLGGFSSPVRWMSGSRAHSPSFQSLHLHHSSFRYPSFVTSHTSQLILQPFCCFTYVMAHSPTLLSLLLHHRIFTYVTLRAAHGMSEEQSPPLHHPGSNPSCPAHSEVHCCLSYLAHKVGKEKKKSQVGHWWDLNLVPPK